MNLCTFALDNLESTIRRRNGLPTENEYYAMVSALLK